MNLTSVEDYEMAIRRFLSDMERLGGDLVSVLLYGSVARGDIVPGESDMLDAHVFLREEVFQSKERFLKVLEIMVEASKHLSQTGIPYHPYHYFSVAEADRSPAIYLPTWQSDGTSKVLFGEDLRPQISSRESSQAVAATSFFEARRIMAHPLSLYLSRRHWTPDERRKIVHRLHSLKKHITIMACFALGIPCEASQAVAELERALPGLDTSVLQRIDSFRSQSEPREELNNLREILREMLLFVEHLHDEVLAALRGCANVQPLR
jgi:predicted nucleotidyltransferase